MANGTVTTFNDAFYVRAYTLAKAGHSDAAIARALNVTDATYKRWLERKAAFSAAVKEGRNASTSALGSAQEFREYVLGRLKGDTAELYKKLTSPDADLREKGEETLSGADRRLKQQIFIHALVTNDFKVKKALQTAMISVDRYKVWRKRDKAFVRMMEGLHEAKKDFFEDALLDLVAQREPSIVRFVNQTVNADRGYGKVLNVKVSGGVDHTHRIDPSKIPLETRRMLLEALRNAKEQKRLESRPQEGKIIEGEFEKSGTEKETA